MRFFERKLPKLHCPLCGGEQFGVTVTDDVRYTFWPTVEHRERADGDIKLPVIPLECQDCGAFFPFSYAFIRRWLAENPAEETK